MWSGTRWVSFTDQAHSIHCVFEPHDKTRKTQMCSTETFTHGKTSDPASPSSGRSVLIQAGSRQMHSNIHAQHLAREESWAVAKHRAETPEWLFVEGASGLSQSCQTVVHPQWLCRSSQVARHLQKLQGILWHLYICVAAFSSYLTFTLLWAVKWLNFYSLVKTSVRVMHCMSRNKYSCAE